MLGMFHLLPLLKGWEYKGHGINQTLVRGDTAKELAINEQGWLMSITLGTNDCKAIVQIQFQGSDLQTITTSVNTDDAFLIGGIVQDPAGWVQRYFRPNPNSTQGIFFSLIFTGGYQGSTFPYVPTIKVKAWLPTESTQASCAISLNAGVIAITDKVKFIQSLRAVLGNKDLEVDEALLTSGPVEQFGQKFRK